MAIMDIFKVTALPETLVANACYLVNEGGSLVQYIVNNAGTAAIRSSVSFNRYDLPYVTSPTGAMDLSVNQIFKIDASTAGAAIAMSFTNPPSNKSMAVVVEISGSARSVTLPTGTVVVDSVSNTLGAVLSVMTFFYDGTKFYLMSNAKVNA